jgi:ribosomal protein S17
MTLTFSQEIKQQDNMIDYSGKWVLNKSQSKSYLSEVATSTMVISQDKNSVTVDITFTTLHGKTINRTKKYVFNESIVIKNTEGDTTVFTCNPASDGKSFSITELHQYMNNSVEKVSKRISVYTLSNDGRNLILKSDDTLPEGSITPESILTCFFTISTVLLYSLHVQLVNKIVQIHNH